MNTQAKTLAICIAISCLESKPLWAVHESGHNLTDEEWSIVRDRVELLDEINYMPTLLPTIMRNRDVLQLTDQQIRSFRDWRKHHYGSMVNTMNKIIEMRIDFKKAALNPGVSDGVLIDMQNDILVLQKELLKIKLTCRKMLVDSFTDEQWDNFAFVVADHPKLASFIQ
jgi:hypothetical protein